MSDVTERMIDPWSGNKLRVPIPAGRDPFVNTPLLAVGPGKDGSERFWISTWNANVGSLAALVTETGEARIHRFGEKRHAGFYSAVQEDEDTLWLCGDLSRVLRFSLRTGQFEEYATGAPPALVFQGMVFDRETGKLFAATFSTPNTTIAAFSFDTRRRKTVKIHSDFSTDIYMRGSFPNGDGTYSCVMHTPGETLLHWDPRVETLQATTLRETLDVHVHRMADGTTYRLIGDEQERRYFPRRGWYDALQREFLADGPRPSREMTWFRCVGQTAWGANIENGSMRVGRWDMRTGEVYSLCTIPDCPFHGVDATTGGKIVAVNMYGYFYRFDGHTGVLEMTRRLPSDSIGKTDCLCRIDEERLLGTPYITQRFWEVNLRTREGYDCGRVAPGAGEVLKTWKIGGKVYMAVYDGGELVEYDPARHPHFPENPRVVAAPPHAMRPAAAADDGRNIYYACSTPFGTLGSTLTRYDSVTGNIRYAVNPLPDQQIVSIRYDRATNSLLCGTTMHADCRSCPPSSNRCYFARIDAELLTVIEQAPAPDGTIWATVEGPLGKGRYLCTCNPRIGWRDCPWIVLDSAAFGVPAQETMQRLPRKTDRFLYAGKPGYFLLQQGPRLEIWDMRTHALALLLTDCFDGNDVKVQDDSVYLIYSREIEVMEGCLRDLC